MWLLSLILGSARVEAYSMAGFGVPCVGGCLAGNAQVGPLGLPYNPAAAWTPGPDFVTDLGSIYSHLTYELDYWDGPDAKGGYSLPIPYLGYATPVGPFGLGFDVIVPYARIGGRDADGPQRYHAISGTFLVVETDLNLAWAPSANWTFGGAFRIGQFIQSSTRSIDTGALLSGILGADAEIPLMDPFLEGSQTLSNMRDTMFGGAAGMRYQSDLGFGVQAAWRPGWTAHVRNGLVVVEPSRDLTALIEGDVEFWFEMPTHLYLSGTIPLGERVTLYPDAQLIRWSEVNTVSRVLDFRLTSTDPYFTSLLESYGISEAEFLDDSKPSAQDLGMNDAYNFGLSAQIDVTDLFQVQPGIHHEPASVPNYLAHPGNLDFGGLRTGLGAVYQSRKWLRLGATFDYWWVRNRNVTNSVMSLTNKQGSGRVYPSGNGTYELELYRVAVMAEVAR